MQDERPEANEDERVNFNVRSDFPAREPSGLISGSQPKLLLSQGGDKLYSPGNSPLVRYQRWRRCEDIAEHLRVKSLECKAGKRSHMTEMEILEQYLERLYATGWVSAAEARWTIRRSAELLGGWPIPKNAREPIDDGN